jgi:multidrug efflux pump subunit AcrB
MVRNGVAANFLMCFILAAGVFSMGGLVQEVLPEIAMDRIVILVPLRASILPRLAVRHPDLS